MVASSSSSGQAREILSSRLTPVLQLAPITLWLSLTLGLAFLWLRGAGTSSASPALVWMALLPLAPPLLLLPVVSLWAAGLYPVATDGASLLISLSDGRTASVPLTLVIDVREWRGMDMRAVTVTFDRATFLGRSVRFLAPTRVSVPRDEPHPVVLALRENVEAAQSATTVASDPPMTWRFTETVGT
jgi:hypothetical protein